MAYTEGSTSMGDERFDSAEVLIHEDGPDRSASSSVNRNRPLVERQHQIHRASSSPLERHTRNKKLNTAKYIRTSWNVVQGA
jgi:hypothetical protein